MFKNLIHHYLPACLLFLILLWGVTACTGTEEVTEEESVEQRDLSHLEEIYWARIDSSRMNFTHADIDFLYGMIPHHSQALIMSRMAPENGASRSVQTLAGRIINAQGDEIDLMQRWLEVRNQPVPEIHIDGLEMMVHMRGGEDHQGHGHHDMHDHSDMPGMLSQEQLEELSAARGEEFDRLFLEFMIEHHKGAVIMVDELFEADGAAQDREMFNLASGIHAEQVTEIERMRQMLEAMDDGQ